MIIFKKIVLTLSFALIIFSAFAASPLSGLAAFSSPAAGTVSVSSGNLNIRSAPNNSSAIIAKAAKGSYLTLHSKSGDWWYAEYANGSFGYCHSAYINDIGGSARKVYTSAGSLNVRSGAGTSYGVIGKISKGSTVVVLSSSGYWSKILYNGSSTGYVYNTYLGPLNGYSSSAAVSLSVPSYKQYDGRWANLKIGSSGKTMAQIGCATTGIAMMESFRTGSTITPADMRLKLKYTASGSVYWPSHFISVTDSTNYLSKISSLLSSGKPVLLGLKNSYGSQHWVVVTGYNGKGLSASNFTINDPGSDSRSNLQQMLNSHPVFYKYFYY